MMKKILIGVIVIIGILFLPTTIILLLGMMPTIAAFTIDKTRGKSKTLCVGFMNFAGCFPFLLDFWTTYSVQTVENALILLADIQNIMIIYILAGGGYAIDLAVTGIVSSLIVQNASRRANKIETRQQELVKQWGDKVTGRYPLDAHGFPVERNRR